MCHTQAEIAEAVGLDRTVVSDRIAEIVGNEQMADSHIFPDLRGDGLEERSPAPDGAGLSRRRFCVQQTNIKKRTALCDPLTSAQVGK